MQPQTAWRPYPFKTEGKEAKLVRLVERRGMVTRKEMLAVIGGSDGAPLYNIMRRAGVGVVGHAKSKTGIITNLYGFTK
jgi:hypothetical protein